MTAFDELQNQLLESVGDRARQRAFPGAVALARWLRERAGTGAALLAAAILVVLVAVSTRGPGAGSVGLDAEAAPPDAAQASGAGCAGCGAVAGRLHGRFSEEAVAGVGAGRHESGAAHNGGPVARWLPASGQADTGHFG
jgi:hypothetical protein